MVAQLLGRRVQHGAGVVRDARVRDDDVEPARLRLDFGDRCAVARLVARHELHNVHFARVLLCERVQLRCARGVACGAKNDDVWALRERGDEAKTCAV